MYRYSFTVWFSARFFCFDIILGSVFESICDFLDYYFTYSRSQFQHSSSRILCIKILQKLYWDVFKFLCEMFCSAALSTVLLFLRCVSYLEYLLFLLHLKLNLSCFLESARFLSVSSPSNLQVLTTQYRFFPFENLNYGFIK